MTVVYKLNGATLPAKNVYLRWAGEEGFDGAQAADGTGAFGQVTFHDPDGTLDVKGWMSFTVDETDCTTAPRLVTAWIWERDYAKGGDELGSTGRIITCSLLDPNAMLSFPLISGQDGNRGAETDADTIDWLLSTYLDGLVQDLGLVNPPPRDFDAANYIGRKPADVLNDLCSPRGQIFFAYWSQTDNAIGLFYDDPTATAFTSTLTISNVPGDSTATCFPPFQDEKLHRDPSEVYDLIRYSKKGGSIVRTNPTTTAAFFSAFSQHRGVQVTNDRVGLRTTAITFADRLLQFYSTERDTFTVTIRVPSTQVGLIDAGMRVGVRFSHLANEGYGSLTYTRVERRTFKQAEGRRGFYDVTLTMSNHGLGTGIGSGGGSTDGFPVDPPATAAHYFSGVFTTYGDDGPDIPADGEAWSFPNGAILAASTDYNYHFEWTDDGHLYSRQIGVQTGGPNDIGDAGANGVFGLAPADEPGVTSEVFAGTFTTPDGAHWDPTLLVYVLTEAAATPHDHLAHGTLSFWIDPVGWDPGAGQEPPPSGSPVPPGVATITPATDGSTTAFTVVDSSATTIPYAPGSLHVEMNGVELAPGRDFTETSGPAGTFGFTRAPSANAEIVLWMQAA